MNRHEEAQGAQTEGARLCLKDQPQNLANPKAVEESDAIRETALFLLSAFPISALDR